MNNELKTEMEKKQSAISGTIDRFESRKAVIKTEDGQELLWPVDDLPENTTEGEAVRLVLTTSQTDEAEREKTAKSILREILKSDDEA